MGLDQTVVRGEPLEREDGVNPCAASLPQLTFRCFGDGRQIWPSPQWVEFTGLGVEESLGFGWLNAIHTEDRSVALAGWRAAESSGIYSVQQRVWSKAEGLFRWHLSRAKSVSNAIGVAANWAVSMTDVHELIERQNRQDVLIAELQHRARNLLAVTLAIARKTVQKSESLQAFKQEFRRRVEALARVQELRGRNGEVDVGLRDLVSSQLDAHGAGAGSTKVTMAGPPVALSASAAQTLGLAVHELATNALKYGALSKSSATLFITWEIRTSAEPVVRFTWKESGMELPQDAYPRRSGYGTELIRRALPFDLGAKTDLIFEPDGLRCIIEVSQGKLSNS